MAWEAYNALMDDPRLLVLDTRNPRVFAAGHIRGSVCVAVSARPGTNTLERLEGCGPPTWSANCWWDRNVLLVPSSGSSSSSSYRDSIKTSRKRKAAESVLGEDNITGSHPVVQFLVKEKLTRSLKILKHDGDEDPFSAFCARYPFLITKSCKPATISGYPSEIVPDLLYLGDQDHAMAENRLNDLHISHVLTIHTEPIVLKKHFVQMFCDLADEPNANIGKYFESMFEFVEAARKSGGRVLVHCGAGASRSATLCAYYVMRVKQWSLEETLKFMRAQRKQVEPNSGFLAVLSEFQDLLGIKSSKVNTLPSSSVWSLSDHNDGKATKVAAKVEKETHPYLKIFKDQQCIDVINLMDRRKLIFGRLGVCDVILGHPSISRQHARLELREASEFVLIDLSSVHGTFVNGKPLPKNGQCVLNVGDVVQFGASTKKYVLTCGQFEAPTNMS